ncbi:MAG: hypothetical protein ACOC6H_04325 [Thermoproteota archaeon]
MGVYHSRAWIMFEGLSTKRISTLLPKEPENLKQKLKKSEDPKTFLQPYITAIKENFPTNGGKYTAYTSKQGGPIFCAKVKYPKQGLMTVVYSRGPGKTGEPFLLKEVFTTRKYENKTAEDFELPKSITIQE